MNKNISIPEHWTRLHALTYIYLAVANVDHVLDVKELLILKKRLKLEEVEDVVIMNLVREIRSQLVLHESYFRTDYIKALVEKFNLNTGDTRQTLSDLSRMVVADGEINVEEMKLLSEIKKYLLAA